MKATSPPPRLAEALLVRAVGPEAAARSIVGDLNEDYAVLRGRRGRMVASAWYWKEALFLGGAALLRRVLDPSVGGTMTIAKLRGAALLQDARHGLLAVKKDLGFSAFATLIVGLGVGATTAVFSVASPLFLKPLPFEEPEHLVLIQNEGDIGGLSAITSRASNLRDFRRLTHSFSGLSGYNAFFEQGSYTLAGDARPERLVGVDVAVDFLEVLGVSPPLGRDFVEEEGVWGGPAAIILTYGFWARRFASDPAVVGGTVTINDAPTEVVGVLPPTFDFSSVFTPAVKVDFLRPFPVGDETDRLGNTLTMVGRLAPGATVASAQEDLTGVIAGLQEAQPDRWGLGARVSSLQATMARPFRGAMLLLSIAAGLVMLIVCANLSNMLLARSPRRSREMAVRLTLGAPRARLVRQLLVESVTIALMGALVGLGVAYLATRFVSGVTGLEIPMLSAVSVDGTALLFASLVAATGGMAFGVVPALQVTQGGRAHTLVSPTRGSTGDKHQKRLRETLVVAEVAMACVLLVLGGLLLRSFRSLIDIDPGFDTEGVVAWQLNPTRPFQHLSEAAAYFDGLVSRVAATPGVEAVGLVDALPLGRNRTWGTSVVGKSYSGDRPGEDVFPHVIDYRYLDAMGIRLVDGRGFTAEDTGESARVVLVNETAARDMFDGNALGQFVIGFFGQAEVVGVVADVKHEALHAPAGYEVYFPVPQLWSFTTLDMVVRSRLPRPVLASAVAGAIRDVDASLPVDEYWTLASMVDGSVSPRRFTLQLLSAFAASALLLATLGIYGVLSYSVTERVPEIAIRKALGESVGEVRWTVVLGTLRLALLGILIGLAGALPGTDLVSSLLYGVAPWDPGTFAAVVSLLLLVAFLAGLIPAVRASRVDAAAALRSVT